MTPDEFYLNVMISFPEVARRQRRLKRTAQKKSTDSRSPVRELITILKKTHG